MKQQAHVYIFSSGIPQIDIARVDELTSLMTLAGFINPCVHLEDSSSPDLIKRAEVDDLIARGQVGALGIYSFSHLLDYSSTLETALNFLAFLSEHGVRLLVLNEELDSQMPAAAFAQKLIQMLPEVQESARGEATRRRLLVAGFNGKHIGRPRKSDIAKIHELRREGLSFKEISLILGISKGSVQYALRNSPMTSEI